MAADLTVRFHDARSPLEPTEWAEFVRLDGENPLWTWRVVHSLPASYGDPIVAASLHDAERVVGVVLGRLRGLRRRTPWVTVADLACPGSASLPGLRLLGSTPGVDAGPADVALYGAAVEAIEVALRAEFPHRVHAVLHRQVYAEQLPVVQRGLGVAYRGVPSAMITHGFADWDSYLAGLRRKRRSNIRTVLTRFDNADDLHVEVHDGLPTADLTAFAALIHDVAERAAAASGRRLKAPGWPPALLAALTTGQSRVQALCYRGSDGRLIAGSILYDHPDVPVHGPWGAPDPKRDALTSGLWVDTLARTIRHNIGTGARGIVGGKGLADLKADFGFTVTPQWSVLRRLSPARTS